jgi:hypothetical protein
LQQLGVNITKDQFYQSFTDTFSTCLTISKAKNADYCGSAEQTDPFANFRLAPSVARITVEQGILVRLSDKLSRIGTLLSQPAQVKDESIDDTILDAINYLAILRALRQSQGAQ